MATATSDELQRAGVRLLERYGVAATDAAPVFELLVIAYSARDRHYHNLEHLDEMFRAVARLASITDDVHVLQLAVWFHDAVYLPQSKTNEARSADLAVDLLGPIGVPRSVLDRVVRLIHATAHVDDSPPGDRETALLLDADLAILGAPAERYDRYAAAIRREYHWVTETEYRTGRVAILDRFLNRPRLFWNDALHDECDGLARANLRRERDRLQ